MRGNGVGGLTKSSSFSLIVDDKTITTSDRCACAIESS